MTRKFVVTTKWKFTTYILFALICAVFCLWLIKTNGNVQLRDYGNVRRIIVTADDFGLHECVNDGIILGIERGVVNTTSVMMNFPGVINEVIDLHSKYPSVKIGVHLNITTGRPLSNVHKISSLVDENGNFYQINKLIMRLDRIDTVELKEELNKQIELLMESGIGVDHMSSHFNILAFYPAFFKVFMELAIQYHLPVRNPTPISILGNKVFENEAARNKLYMIAIKSLLKRPIYTIKLLKYTKRSYFEELQEELRNRNILFPDYMVDAMYGNPESGKYMKVLSNLPYGTSEIIFHLGKNCTCIKKVTTGVDTAYFKIRDKELETASNSIIILEINKNNISFDDL